MEMGNLIWFSSRQHPFAVRQRHCLDLECSCTDAWLTFTEVNLCGTALKNPLSFEIRINLRNGRERRPPKRSGEIHVLVREFLARCPAERFQEMINRRQHQRAVESRLESYTVDASKMGEVLSYSDVIFEEGGMATSGRRYSFFYVHEGRGFLVEDYYCPRPTCDCRKVHVEFWERIESSGRSPRVDVMQRLMVVLTLNGEFGEIQFSDGDPRDWEDLWRGWLSDCSHQLEECGRRYQQIKVIGRRSVPRHVEAPVEVAAPVRREPLGEPAADSRVGRNRPCPCGSGKKFKRCCARRETGD